MNLKTYLFLVSSAFAFPASAQFIEQFNSRAGISGTEVKNYLQASCWNFSSFVCSNKPGELIEGDGSILSIPAVNPAIPSGIYSPLLDLGPTVSVMFKYRILSSGSTNRSCIKIYLANAGNEPQVLLDSLAVEAQINSMQVYKRDFSNINSGPHKLFIQYCHQQENSRLVLDDIAINAAMHYRGGCNTAPVANADMVFLDQSGQSKTSITSNDSDLDKDQFIPRIESGSADGAFELNADNRFVFKANPGFRGSTTEFRYRICETAANGLCSESTRVIVRVPTAVQKSELLEFTGQYRQGGNIDLHLRTFAGHTSRQFDIERSLDGKSWEQAGTVMAGAAEQYVFNDHVKKNTANKKDIYYRLKEVKKDDEVITSKLLILRVYNSPGVQMVSVSPNPHKNDINVTLQLNQPSIASMKVVSSTGDEVFRKTVKTAGEVSNILLDGTSKLQPGEYTLDVIINSKERMFVPLLKE